MKQILLITLGLSTALFASFYKNGNIVTDSNTGLQWQDDSSTTMAWAEAIDYCENLNLDGFNDWRLPNINELLSITDDTKFDPSIDTSVFQYTGEMFRRFQSSTTNYHRHDMVWSVSFNDGTTSNSDKSTAYYVKCVRAGK